MLIQESKLYRLRRRRIVEQQAQPTRELDLLIAMLIGRGSRVGQVG
jgi:hypothetical protein